MINLAGKTALVTGSANGIGFGCALQLAKAGADIILNDRPESKELDAAAEKIRAIGVTCHAIEADVFARGGCEALVGEGISQAGKIDILVSNPAFNQRQNFLDFEPENFEKILQCSLLGGFHVSQFVARHMVERGEGGKITFISSVLGEIPNARCMGYSAAKAALNQMSKTIAVELFQHRINVNTIMPGWIDTPGERKHYSEEVLLAESRKLPWGRFGKIEEIGNAVAFLSSNLADYITGTTIPVDGGYRLKDCAEIPVDGE